MILGQPSAHLGFASERKRLTAPTMSARPAGLSAPASSFRGQQIKAPTLFSLCRQTVLVWQTPDAWPAQCPFSAWPASTGRYSASRIYSASSHQTTALTFMAVCASKAKDLDPPNLRQTTSLRQVPRSSASSKRFPRFSAGQKPETKAPARRSHCHANKLPSRPRPQCHPSAQPTGV